MSRRTVPVLIQVVTAAVLLAGARALSFSVHDGFLLGGHLRAGSLGLARHALDGLWWCVPLAFVGLALVRLGRRGGRNYHRLALGVVAMAGFLFVSSRLPYLATHVPGFHSAFGWGGNFAAIFAGSIGALLVESPFRSRRIIRGMTLFSGIVLAALLAILLGVSPERATWPERPNVILVSIDTLRPSHLGAYGYDRPTSPELDRFAQRAVRFTRAYTPYPWTLTAHVTMLTSLTPTAHGVDQHRRLSPEAPVLAEELREAGYRTVAMVDQVPWLSPVFGFSRGFDLYRTFPETADRRHVYMWPLLDDLRDAPFFLFLHYYDVHSDFQELPYEADAGDRELLAGDYEGDFSGCLPDAGCATALLEELSERGTPPDSEITRYIMGLYDAGIRTLDRELGDLFRYLDESGMSENTVVLITADHGEAFFEHGVGLHHGLWEESVTVPLLVRTPDTDEARVVDEIVGLRDIAPTVLDLCNLPAPRMQGTSFRPLVDGKGTWKGAGVAFLDDGGEQFSLRTPAWKLTRDEDGAWAFYDMRTDPGERTNLYDNPEWFEDRSHVQALLDHEIAEARRYRDRFGATEVNVSFSPRDREKLRALGYGGVADEDGE